MTFEFAVGVVKFYGSLDASGKKVIANQLHRSGTSVGANIGEAQNGESLCNFIHNFKIAAKELYESIYWLEICEKTESYPSTDLNSRAKAIEIKKVISKIISSSKRRFANGTYAKESLSNYLIAELTN